MDEVEHGFVFCNFFAPTGADACRPEVISTDQRRTNNFDRVQKSKRREGILGCARMGFYYGAAMSLSSLSSASLQKLIRLIKEKEVLQAKLAKVKAELESLESGSPAKTPKTKKTGARRGRRRLKLKDKILKALQAAGKGGRSVKDLAEDIKANPGSVSVWFYTTGKKTKGIRKIGPARYSYSE